MGHKVYRAHLIAVQINRGRAEDSSVLDGGGDVLLKVVGEGYLVVRMAVAADWRGSVKLHFLIRAALLQGAVVSGVSVSTSSRSEKLAKAQSRISEASL